MIIQTRENYTGKGSGNVSWLGSYSTLGFNSFIIA